MIEPLIEKWLNDEMDEGSTSRLEEQLRQDPDQLRLFFDAVQLQEQLRQLHVGETPASVTFRSQGRQRLRLVIALCAAAAVVAVALLIFPRTSDPRSTEDPRVWVLSGQPQVEIVKIAPGPNPIPIPRKDWPVETRVTTSSEPGSLRWNEICVLDLGTDTALALRLASERVNPKQPQSIHLKAGRVTVRLEASTDAIDLLAGSARIRTNQPAVFTLETSGPRPSGAVTRMSVVRGSVELLLPDGEKRLITAGERVSIP